jgi:hypothetical protein
MSSLSSLSEFCKYHSFKVDDVIYRHILNLYLQQVQESFNAHQYAICANKRCDHADAVCPQLNTPRISFDVRTCTFFICMVWGVFSTLLFIRMLWSIYFSISSYFLDFWWSSTALFISHIFSFCSIQGIAYVFLPTDDRQRRTKKK